jgi:hypothetical protein
MSKSFLFILILVTGTAFCQNYSLKNISSTDTEYNIDENVQSKKFIDEISVFGNFGVVLFLGRLRNEGKSGGDIGINFGIQTRFLKKYNFFIAQEYVKFGYANHPASDHWFIIKNYNAGIKYEFDIENNQKINVGLGLGPYFYEKDKRDDGEWGINESETCFGGSLGVNAEIPLSKYYSLIAGPAIHAFHSSNKGWLSYVFLNIGMRFGYSF